MNARYGSSSFAAIFTVASLVGVGAGGYRLMMGSSGGSCAAALTPTSGTTGLCPETGRLPVCGGAMLAPTDEQALVDHAASTASSPHASQECAPGNCRAAEGATEATRESASDTSKKAEHVSAAAER
jgi:hypothetical protein